jgi:hypothetical protein
MLGAVKDVVEQFSSVYVFLFYCLPVYCSCPPEQPTAQLAAICLFPAIASYGQQSWVLADPFGSWCRQAATPPSSSAPWWVLSLLLFNLLNQLMLVHCISSSCTKQLPCLLFVDPSIVQQRGNLFGRCGAAERSPPMRQPAASFVPLFSQQEPAV